MENSASDVVGECERNAQHLVLIARLGKPVGVVAARNVHEPSFLVVHLVWDHNNDIVPPNAGS